jgi:heat shock protein HslJ
MHPSLPLFRRGLFWLACVTLASLVISCVEPRASVKWSLTGTVWKLVELNGEVVASNQLPSLSLDAAGHRISGLAGVNLLSGAFTQHGPALSFSSVALTKKAGPPEQMKLEEHYLAMLGRVTGWRIEGQWLELFAGETEVARFQGLPAGAPL